MSPVGIEVEFVDADSKAAEVARQAFAAAGIVITANSTTIDGLLDRPQSSCPQAIVLDASACGGEPARAVREALVHCPESVIVITGAGIAAGSISRAVSAGARGFLLKPYQPSDLAATVRDAYDSARSLGRTRTPQAARGGHLVPVYSPKGGVGCTTIATNLAVALASRGLKVALIDLDLQFGDVGSALDLKSANSIVDLLGQAELTDDLIGDTFVTHSSGVQVLLAPDNLSLVEGIDPADVVTLLRGLTARFDYVICDLWSSLEELSLQTMKAADRVVLVTTPELPALRNLQRVVVGTQDRLDLDAKGIFVANRLPGKGSLTAPEIVRAFGREFVAAIPSEGVGVTEAINRGLSFFDARVNPRIAKHYKVLADAVVGSLDAHADASGHSTPAIR